VVSTESKIETYLRYFSEKVNRLESYKFANEDRLLKKAIIVSILDALSRTTSNEGASNYQRFTGIVEKFSDWSYHDRLSATHLQYFLAKLRSPEFEKARIFIHKRISLNSNGVPTLDQDPRLSELQPIWPCSPDQNLIDKLSLRSFSHLNLFYQYRNSLVHELREPGHGMEFNNSDDEPFYHTLTTDDKEQTLELVYPLNFYFKIVRNVLQNLKGYLVSNKIDPYSCYEFGSSYVGILNK